ncbi:HAD-IA family hydrolase [Rubrivirga sp. S365]|uniref:HAD-IA family hydrolase n=1 Tax=Rubrivirga litoralis TaxID=3075598 RepID=A0ABU3BN79_9BACT|nr:MULTISPECIES: HAD-IA family hydrolase [unclassified Rubrivirga]MDT0630718.1 HAD-IA family hydrolase [Rubrivirga sp. F394]MDT7856388.1 HAD-IA family hydrolase [Rubrivirga sp. S365]
MALSALLLDLDGTLTDSNDAHAEGFVRAAKEFGLGLPKDRFDLVIGKGADHVVPDVFGPGVEAEHGEAMRDAIGRAFREIAAERTLRLLDGAERLIDAARERGLTLALATSSAEGDLDALFESVGTDLRDRFDVVTTSSDVDGSKPEPDLVRVVADKLGLPPAACALVGDTVYDAEAALRGGAAFVGVATWVWSEDDLRGAGARAVYASTAALVGDLDAALAAAAPGDHALSDDGAGRLMDAALAQAREAFEAGDAPIGAAIGRGDGTVVAVGRNRAATDGDRLRHAETDALHALAERGGLDEPGLVLATTLEPCAMCLGAMTEAGVHASVYALAAPPNGAAGHLSPLPGRTLPLVARGPGRDESLALLRRAADRDGGFAARLVAAVDAE